MFFKVGELGGGVGGGWRSGGDGLERGVVVVIIGFGWVITVKEG